MSCVKNRINYYFADFIDQIRSFNILEEEINKRLQGKEAEKERSTITERSIGFQKEGNTLFFAYAQNHINSYVTLWKLIEMFKNKGYKCNIETFST